MRKKFLFLLLAIQYLLIGGIIFGLGLYILFYIETPGNGKVDTPFYDLGFFLFSLGISYFVLGWLLQAGIYWESCLFEGNTKQIYKANKKKAKLKAKKKAIELRLNNKEECSKLECQIHSLELELKESISICKECGTKNYKIACYCSKCGNKLKED